MKVCVVTAARSEYGLLRWLMQDIKDDPALTLQVVVTGSHLSPDFGYTWHEIEDDGFSIDAKVEMLLASPLQTDLVKSTGICALGIADVFEQLQPDLLVVLGDRYEMLPICSAALLMSIPIAHISGGDVTEGAIDDQIRHALTKMAALHLVSSPQAAARVRQMGEEEWRICLAGGPGMDNIRRLPALSREELAHNLGLDPNKEWALFTWHPETKISLQANLKTVNNIFEALGKQANLTDKLEDKFNDKLKDNLQVIATYANADYGGREINQALEQAAKEANGKIVVRQSLGQLRYVNMLKHAKFMIGNSSSAIFETPALKLPAINIGNRQKGRALTPNIISSGYTLQEILNAIKTVDSPEFKQRNAGYESPYGDGFFAEKALFAIKQGLKRGKEKLLLKKFVDL